MPNQHDRETIDFGKTSPVDEEEATNPGIEVPPKELRPVGPEDVARLFYSDLQHRYRQSEIWKIPGSIAIMVRTMERWVEDRAKEVLEDLDER